MAQISCNDLKEYLIELIMLKFIVDTTTDDEHIPLFNDKIALKKYIDNTIIDNVPISLLNDKIALKEYMYKYQSMIHYGTWYYVDTCTDIIYKRADAATMPKNQLIKAILKEISVAHCIEESININIYRPVIYLIEHIPDNLLDESQRPSQRKRVNDTPNDPR
jgi:hypothetical protein